MAKGLRVWIYRPDIEAQARKINRNFVYNAHGEAYFEVVDRENAAKAQIKELKEKIKKRVLDSTIEV